jgi:hypothetical protein
MKLSEFKTILSRINELDIVLPSGERVPKHFHVTEVGQIHKHFIDCGGTVRHEKTVGFQLWKADDLEHRLRPEKLNNIITLSENVLGIEDAEIEVEYQGETINKYGIDFNGLNFVLTSKTTDCLAPDKCGVPAQKSKVKLSELQSKNNSCCSPGTNCC